MPHSFTKIWIHGVLATKDRKPLILPHYETKLYGHLKHLLIAELNCGVEIVNGMSDHVHLLFYIGREESIAHIFKILKGNSSHWINEHRFVPGKFEWQVGYSAFSVSYGHVERVTKYVANQKIHHRRAGFDKEHETFLRLHNLQ